MRESVFLAHAHVCYKLDLRHPLYCKHPLEAELMVKFALVSDEFQRDLPTRAGRSATTGACEEKRRAEKRREEKGKKRREEKEEKRGEASVSMDSSWD